MTGDENPWARVNAWVLRRQRLVGPKAATSPAGLAGLVSNVGCVQAQSLPCARAALSLRTADPVTPEAFARALAPGSGLLRTWLMRGTMHLVAACDWPDYVSAFGPAWIGWHLERLVRQGIPPSQHDSLLDQYRRVFEREQRPLTREELGAILSREAGRTITVSGWAGAIRLLCYRGELVFGPPAGNRVTLALARHQLGAAGCPPPRAPEEALVTVLTHYLRAFGPATAADFRHWTGLRAAAVQPACRQAVDSGLITAVPFENDRRREYFLLREDLPAFLEFSGGSPVPGDGEDRDGQGRAGKGRASGGLEEQDCVTFLLPRFENLLLAYANKDRLVDREYSALVFKPVAEIAATVLDRGRIAGTWKAAGSGRRRRVVAELFPAYDLPGTRARVEAAAERLEEKEG